MGRDAAAWAVWSGWRQFVSIARWYAHYCKGYSATGEAGVSQWSETQTNPEIVVHLKVSHSQRAQCRVGEDRWVRQAVAAARGNEVRDAYRKEILDDYRIHVDGVIDGMYSHWVATHYYHVPCFDTMVEAKSLFPSGKFKIDTRRSWGLMERKWFEHRSCISLGKIEAYIESCEKYDEELEEWYQANSRWWNVHYQQRETKPDGSESEPPCGCPPRPQEPDEPVLRDYTVAKEDACSLRLSWDTPTWVILVTRSPGTAASFVRKPKLRDEPDRGGGEERNPRSERLEAVSPTGEPAIESLESNAVTKSSPTTTIGKL